jgi:hypothetical protein
MQQINVILPIAGADQVGLPAELQGYVDFAVGEAAPLIRKSGTEPPPR